MSREDEVKRLREAGAKLESALDRIDAAIMPPEDRQRDIEAVGAPITDYQVQRDEDAVVARVEAFAAKYNHVREVLDVFVAGIGGAIGKARETLDRVE